MTNTELNQHQKVKSDQLQNSVLSKMAHSIASTARKVEMKKNH